MGQSWSNMRKQLEQEYLCDSLKGRIQFFVTRYPRTSDVHTRVAIRLDNREILQSDFIKWRKACDGVDLNTIEIHNQGGFDAVEFYHAFHTYQNQSIEKSFRCDDPLVRLFAILDRRIGKKTLKEAVSELINQPEWLRQFYLIRLEVEGIAITAV